MSGQWSFSGLKQFSNCPHQFHQVKIVKAFTVPDTDQTLYGKAVHTALEEYVRDGKPLAKNYLIFKPSVDALLAIEGEKFCEVKMGLKSDRVSYCDFDDPEYWVHGIADLVILNDSCAYVVDYKTGNPRYADSKQLKLMALMVFAKYPQVEQIRTGLLFLGKQVFMPEIYYREEIPNLWEAFEHPLRLLDAYTKRGVWPKNPSGLCRKHCPVNTCEHNGQRS